MSDVQAEMNELLDQDEQQDIEQEDENEETAAEGQGDAESSEQEGEPEDVVIAIEGVEPEQEEDQQNDREWLRNLRKEHKALKKRNRELEQQLQSPQAQPLVPDIGPKPTLESCEYDPDAYEKKMADWWEAKAKADKIKEAKQAEQEAAKREWQSTLDTYKGHKEALGIADIEDIESDVVAALGAEKHAIIVASMDNPAKVTAALGMNKALLEKFSSMKSLPRMVAELAKLEDKMTVQKRTKPAPERRISGAGKPAAVTKQSLDDLKEECLRKGDMNPYYRAKEKYKAG
jgi:hypothetical protein